MMRRCKRRLLGLASSSSGAPKDPSYRLLKKLTLGGERGWDYFDVEPGTGHVFVPRRTHIVVVDAEGKQKADIPDMKGAHAIVFAPELKRALLSTEGTVTILDLATGLRPSCRRSGGGRLLWA